MLIQSKKIYKAVADTEDYLVRDFPKHMWVHEYSVLNGVFAEPNPMRDFFSYKKGDLIESFTKNEVDSPYPLFVSPDMTMSRTSAFYCVVLRSRPYFLDHLTEQDPVVHVWGSHKASHKALQYTDSLRIIHVACRGGLSEFRRTNWTPIAGHRVFIHTRKHESVASTLLSNHLVTRHGCSTRVAGVGGGEE